MKKYLSVLTVTIVLTACTTSNPPDNNSPTATPEVTSTTATVTPVKTASPSPTITTSSWKIHTLPAIGLSFRLPPKMDGLGVAKQEIAVGETGTQLCVQFAKSTAWYENLIPVVEAGGGCGTAPNKFIAIGTTSTDYSAGREGTFLDMQGFAKQDGKYMERFVRGALNESFPQENIIPVNNPNGVEVIKILGRTEMDDGPTIANSLGDRTGALVNTKEKTYPGLAFMFEETLTQEEIDGILMSIKFSK